MLRALSSEILGLAAAATHTYLWEDPDPLPENETCQLAVFSGKLCSMEEEIDRKMQSNSS